MDAIVGSLDRRRRKGGGAGRQRPTTGMSLAAGTTRGSAEAGSEEKEKQCAQLSSLRGIMCRLATELWKVCVAVGAEVDGERVVIRAAS